MPSPFNGSFAGDFARTSPLGRREKEESFRGRREWHRIPPRRFPFTGPNLIRAAGDEDLRPAVPGETGKGR